MSTRKYTRIEINSPSPFSVFTEDVIALLTFTFNCSAAVVTRLQIELPSELGDLTGLPDVVDGLVIFISSLAKLV